MSERLDRLRTEREAWESNRLGPTLERIPERKTEFVTHSGLPVKPLYTPEDLEGWDYSRELGFPGQYPYTRGVQPSGYRGRFWTRRQVAGFHTPVETNERLKFLIAQGQTGLNVVVDMPTWFGLDPDDELAAGEVGREGVPLSTLQDMEDVFRDIPLDQVGTSLIHAGTATTAMYLTVAKKRGIALADLQGTTQNDMLLLYHSSNIYNLPLELNMRLLTDVAEYTTRNVPRWNPVSISGYNARESGCSAVQEIAFAIGDGIAYAEAFLTRGLKIDEVAPRISFFLSSHRDFFEEICKYRAMRRMWAKVMKERFGARDERSMMMRFHVQTAGSTLTAQLPLNNVVRTAVQALAAVLGGTQSLHCNGYDEALGLPTAESARLSLHTQLILAHECGVTGTIDPLAGSYFVESLTNRLEEESWRLLEQVSERGGMVAASLSGWVQRQKAQFVEQHWREVTAGSRVVVGVNAYQAAAADPGPLFRIDPRYEAEQIGRVRRVRAERDSRQAQLALVRMEEALLGGENTMEATMEAVAAYATLGEIHAVYRKHHGEIREPEIFASSVLG